MIFLGGGFGFTKDTFYPKQAGRFEEIGMTEGLSPLARHKNDLTMVTNLTNMGASDPHGGSTSYLTGANVAGTPGKRFHNSISCDHSLPSTSAKTPALPPSSFPPRRKMVAKTPATEKASLSLGTKTATPFPESTSLLNSITNSSLIPATPVTNSMLVSRKSNPSSTSSASMEAA